MHDLQGVSVKIDVLIAKDIGPGASPTGSVRARVPARDRVRQNRVRRGGEPPELMRRVSLVALALGIGACGGSVKEPVQPADPRQRTVRDTRIVHEPCDVKRGGGTDVNGDGRADLVVVRSGAWEKCTAADLNFDGVWDSYVYKSRDGKVRRRETDFDRDGRIDEITTYEGGVIATKFSATTLGGKLDTWRFYENGKPVNAERDADGDAAIDQWWEFPKGPDCPLIHTDVDSDGRPDPGATVDFCVATGESDAEDELDSERFGSVPSNVLTETDGEAGSEPTETPQGAAGGGPGRPAAPAPGDGSETPGDRPQ